MDTGCAVHGMRSLQGAEVGVVSHTRLLSRVLRSGGNWLIAGLRVLYIRDLLIPRNPHQVPDIDEVELSGFRDSYRYLSYVLAQSGHVPRTDLPGVDLPETVAALRAGEQRWIEAGSQS